MLKKINLKFQKQIKFGMQKFNKFQFGNKFQEFTKFNKLEFNKQKFQNTKLLGFIKKCLDKI